MYAPLVCFLVFLFFSFSNGDPTSRPFYVITNMANSGPAVDYAVKSGSNAIKVDLSFNDDGTPNNFEHGGACDCLCSVNEICSMGLGLSCFGSQASNLFKPHMKKILEHKDKITLVIIDSQISSNDESLMHKAGKAIITELDENLFDKGYKGDVIISTPNSETYEFIRLAVETSKQSKHPDRYFFTFDEMNEQYSLVAALLTQMPTYNRVIGIGASACLPLTFYDAAYRGVVGREIGQMGLDYVWTVDDEVRMGMYIDTNVQALVTNNPSRLRTLADTLGLKLASSKKLIPDSKNEVRRKDNSCDCKYNGDGCMISIPAPPLSACKCKYKGFWMCEGKIESCKPEEERCQHPDGSKKSCELGGGDCTVAQSTQPQPNLKPF